jgi:arylsulfatase A-like enzyme
LIVADTLRADVLGAYGDREVATPNLDAFAAEAASFTAAYPESLPTIPVRRALLTGRRAYPFRDYRPLKWDIVYLPGWQPMENDEVALAERLAAAGYHTGFVASTLPYFAPGMNFTRGFWQWHYARGLQQDRYRSVHTVTPRQLERYGSPDQARPAPYSTLVYHVANTARRHTEEDTPAAQAYRWAMEFVDDNRHAEPLFLVVDTFEPHEPWEAPASYLERYADPGYAGRTVPLVRYGPMAGQLTEAELRHVRAHYHGLVSLVDTWFGRFIDTLKRLGLYDRSVIAFISDHGTNFGDTPDRIVGKPQTAMYPGVMQLPLLVRFPGGTGAGERFPQLVYNMDLSATFYAAAGIGDVPVDGQDLYALVSGNRWQERDYLTCRYGNELWYRDTRFWVLLDLDGQPRGVFDLEDDPRCQRTLAGTSTIVREVVRRAWQRLLDDAAGALPDHRNRPSTDAIGRPRPAQRE